MSFQFDSSRRKFLKNKGVSEDEITTLEHVVTRCLAEPRSTSKVKDLDTLKERLCSLRSLLFRLDPKFRADLDYGVRLCRGEGLEWLERTLAVLESHAQREHANRKHGPGRPKEYERFYWLLHRLDYIGADPETTHEVTTAALEAARPGSDTGERARHAMRYFDELSQQDHIDKFFRQ